MQDLQDCYAYYETLRQQGGIHWDGKYRCWFVTDYAVAKQLLKDPRVSSDTTELLKKTTFPTREQDKIDPIVKLLSHWLLFSDPPYHTHLRKVLNPYFQASAIESFRPQIRDILGPLLKENDRRCDFVDDVATPLPIMVILRLLGFPEDKHAQIAHWHNQLAPCINTVVRTPLVIEPALSALNHLKQFINAQVDHLKQADPKGFVATTFKELSQIQDFDLDCYWMIVLMLISTGTETTTALLSNALLLILSNDPSMNQLRKNPEQIERAVKECLRLESPAQSMIRVAKEDVEIAEVNIKAGDYIRIFNAAVNRDPAVFAQPENFQPTRSPNAHMSFGYGIHFCLGRLLAKAVAEEALRYLMTHYQRIDFDADSVEISQGITIRQVSRLVVSLNRN